MTWLVQHEADSADPMLAKFYVLGPSMLLAGLPAWWVLGGYMRWMARIKKIGLLPWIDELRARLSWCRPGGTGDAVDHQPANKDAAT